MKAELIFILFVGLGLPLLAFLSGLYYLKKNQGRENRINRVVTQMMDGSCEASSLLHRLFMSGVLDLENGREIIEACYRIEKQRGKNPLPDKWDLSSDDLKPFFNYVSINEIDLSNTPIQEVLNTYKNKMTFKAAA